MKRKPSKHLRGAPEHPLDPVGAWRDDGDRYGIRDYARVTGLVMSLGTTWGLFRHYWVLISLVLTVIATAVLLVETRTISSLGEMAADPTTSAEHLRAMPSTLVHSVGGTVVLLVVLVLNMYKPQGLTRYGWRKLQAERAERRHLVP